MNQRDLTFTMLGAIVALAAAGCGGASPATSPGPQPAIASRDRVVDFCAACHAFPPPDSFPKASWDGEVRRGFDFYRKSDMKLSPPSIASVVAFYEGEAPAAYPIIPRTQSGTGCPVAFEHREIAGPHPDAPTSIAYVGLANLTDPKRPDVLACDMARGELLIRRAAEPDGPATVLASDLAHPAHAEVADLDGDGIKDLLVADLGVPMPSDERRGRVLWLRGKKDGTYETVVLASGLGRVCDVQAADFDGDGDLDLIVAVFGWHRAGEILLLEQKPGPDGRPAFTHHQVDNRHGTIHVPVVDLNGDGKPDFVALISQEYETVVAFMNEGGGKFKPRTLFTAPHPAFGSSGLQLADIDGDGDVDVLLTNGDVYDSPLLKPYHGVSWLENRGADREFARHEIGAVYGAHRALAGDVDGDGDIDVVAVSFLGEPFYDAARRDVGGDSVILFEQLSRGKFKRHAIERESCDYPTLALGDLDADGKLDLVAGRFRSFAFSPEPGAGTPPPGPNAPIVIWKNLGKPKP